jgi:di/tripeptidase
LLARPTIFDLRAAAALSAIGGKPIIHAANGGIDANWMVRHGVSTVTFGAGQNEPHTIGTINSTSTTRHVQALQLFPLA